MNTTKYNDTLLPFLALMRKELHANTDKGDREAWLGMSSATAMTEVRHHARKLEDAVGRADAAGIAEHCADVANCAMMLADICTVLPAEPDGKEFDVRRIMLDIVPGDGDGYEVYAKNIGQVEEALSKGYMEVEDLQGRVETLRAQLVRTREAFVVAVGDKSPFAKMALADIDEVLSHA